MSTCFVIQPFDNGGRFDKRYKDVFSPAIQEAGLEPYRVDNDPSVSVPIEDIQDGIRRATACLADITLDNPNVWFELGYALASDKQICLVCSEDRIGKYPFDVQHRSIINYRLESKSDFAALQEKIVDRLRAIIAKSQTLAIIEAQSPIREEGILQHEMIVLASIMENLQGPTAAVSHSSLREELGRLGYNNLALNIGLEGLLRRKMISCSEERDYDNNYTFSVYTIEPEGMTWLLGNYERLNLRNAPRSTQKRKTVDNILDDEIPF